jgi:hypothetical protein
MSVRVCYGLGTDYLEHLVETIKVPAGVTLKVGDVITAEALVAGSNKVYAGAVVADITTADLLIIPDQRFYEDAQGRRYEATNLLTELSFTEGMVITAIRLQKHMKFEISVDSLANTATEACKASRTRLWQS